MKAQPHSEAVRARPCVDRASAPNARTHGGRQLPVPPPRTPYVLGSGISLEQEDRAVKPSASPSVVRIHHLPLPAKTAR